MPHVLHVIEYLDKGGATRAALSTAKESSNLGPYEHSIVSLKPAHPEAIELANEANVQVHETPSVMELDGLIDDADIVQVEYWNAPAVNHFLHTSLPPSRLAIWFHIAGTSSPQKIHQRVFDFADIPIACAPTPFHDHPVFKHATATKRYPQPALVTAPADFDRINKISPAEHEGFNVGYIGTLSFVKMHPEFIPMSANIEIPDSKFIVCGEGNQEELKKQAAALGATDRFEFRGFVEDIKSVLEILDVYGYPLCEDTYAAAELNLQEVMYAGIPPVVFPHGGIKGLIQHNKTGLFVTNNEDYRRAIEYLYYNPVERRRLGINAAAYARAHFGAKNAARSINKVYEKLLTIPKRYHVWGEEPQKFAPKLSHKKASQNQTSDIFIESLGVENNLFRLSKHESDVFKQIEVEQEIGKSSYQVFNSGIYRYLMHTPTDPYMNLWAGLYLEENGNHAEALTAYAAAISANLNDWRVQWYLGRTLKKLGKMNEAQRVYASLHQHIPDFESITNDDSFAASDQSMLDLSQEAPQLDEEEKAENKPEHTIRVSAIVSTYNAESFMEGCMQNLINQTLFRQNELEIIVVDACSEENEKAIVEKYERLSDNIIYVRTEQRETLYASWNRGIQMARGTYITSANTDDRHREDALEKLANCLDDYPEIALTYPGQIDTSIANETFAKTSSTKVLDWPVYTYQELERHCIIGSQPMWRRSLHETYGLFRDAFKSAGDYEFWLRVGKHEMFFRYPEVLGLYYRNPRGIEHGSDTSKREALQIWQEYGMFDRGIPVILNGRIVTSPDILDEKTEAALIEKQAPVEAPGSPFLLPFDSYINNFEEQLLRQNYEESLQIARQATEQYPDLPYAHLLQSIALRQLGDFEKALLTLEQSIQLEETPEALLELVQLSISTGNLEEAFRTQIYIKEQYPEWSHRVENIPQEDLASEQPIEQPTEDIEEQAEEQVELVQQDDSALEQPIEEQAEEIEETEETGGLVEALQHDDSAQELSINLNEPDHQEVHEAPAGLEDLDYTVKSFDELRAEFENFINIKDVKHAEELALAATRKFPDNSEAWLLKATSHRLKGSFDEAKEAIQQSLLIEDTPKALIELLELSISLGDKEGALQIAEAIKQSYPEQEPLINELLENRVGTIPTKSVSFHPALRNFAPMRHENKALIQASDVCIVSFPGSGNSWLSTLLADVLQQLKGYPTNQVNLPVAPAKIVTDLHTEQDKSAWMDLHGYDFQLFKTFDIAGIDTHKMVYLFRDPIESLISAFHHCNQIPYLKHLAGSSCDAFCLDNIENYNLHLNAALILKEAYPDRVLLLNIKNITEQQTEPIESLHRFLGIPYNASIVQKAIHNCDTERFVVDKTQSTPITFSSLDFLQPGNEISRITLDSILSTLLPVYQEASELADKYEDNQRVLEIATTLRFSQPA